MTAQPGQPNRRPADPTCRGPGVPVDPGGRPRRWASCLAELSGQRGTVGAGALNTDSINRAVAVQPLHKGAIAGR